jgi:hypothetical protein
VIYYDPDLGRALLLLAPPLAVFASTCFFLICSLNDFWACQSSGVDVRDWQPPTMETPRLKHKSSPNTHAERACCIGLVLPVETPLCRTKSGADTLAAPVYLTFLRDTGIP